MFNDTTAPDHTSIAGNCHQIDRNPRLLDQVRNVIRCKHYSIRTEYSYTEWIKRFIYFHNKQHPEI